jgi:hypothetical protein
MNYRPWNIFCWNVRDVNGKDKWVPIRNKIEETMPIFSVFKKQKGKYLIWGLSENLLLKDLISLTIVLLLVLLGELWFVGHLITSLPTLWKRRLLLS